MPSHTRKCLITAGPTREYFDPVRYISNPSSGKMGYGLAEAAVEVGWEVTLVSGPVCLSPPSGAQVHQVVTSEQMLNAVHACFPECDVLIMTAAVCDFRPAQYHAQKTKKEFAEWTVSFEPTPDILQSLMALKQHQTTIGFAAETNDIEANARKKLREKNLDWIAANRVGIAKSGFEADENEIKLIGKTGQEHDFGPASKKLISRDMVAFLSEVA